MRSVLNSKRLRTSSHEALESIAIAAAPVVAPSAPGTSDPNEPAVTAAMALRKRRRLVDGMSSPFQGSWLIVQSERSSPAPTPDSIYAREPDVSRHDELSPWAPPVYSDGVREVSPRRSRRAAGRALARRDADGAARRPSPFGRRSGHGGRALAAGGERAPRQAHRRRVPADDSRRSQSPVCAGETGSRPCAGVARGDRANRRVIGPGVDSGQAAAVCANVLRPPRGPGGGRDGAGAGSSGDAAAARHRVSGDAAGDALVRGSADRPAVAAAGAPQADAAVSRLDGAAAAPRRRPRRRPARALHLGGLGHQAPADTRGTRHRSRPARPERRDGTRRLVVSSRSRRRAWTPQSSPIKWRDDRERDPGVLPEVLRAARP